MRNAAHKTRLQPAGLTHTRKRRREGIHFVCLPRRTAWEPASEDPFTSHELRGNTSTSRAADVDRSSFYHSALRARQDRQHRSSCPATGGAVWTPDSGLGTFPNLEARHDLRRPDPESTPAFTGIPDRQWVVTALKGKDRVHDDAVRNGPGIGCTDVYEVDARCWADEHHCKRSKTRSARIGGRWRAVSPQPLLGTAVLLSMYAFGACNRPQATTGCPSTCRRYVCDAHFNSTFPCKVRVKRDSQSERQVFVPEAVLPTPGSEWQNGPLALLSMWAFCTRIIMAVLWPVDVCDASLGFGVRYLILTLIWSFLPVGICCVCLLLLLVVWYLILTLILPIQFECFFFFQCFSFNVPILALDYLGVGSLCKYPEKFFETQVFFDNLPSLTNTASPFPYRVKVYVRKPTCPKFLSQV
ncbi:hypothetical protein CVT26_007874 [Gymnopilus dilepis]|uniref:Uncharacterized protein n=1 Tax=Gymnopilus dilepis TaxID=231916 RepID=A0A409YKB5_9AGAR|nr:hypothetical protein CVT26_007874 [Gymnopilus dilepis]